MLIRKVAPIGVKKPAYAGDIDVLVCRPDGANIIYVPLITGVLAYGFTPA